LLAIPAFDRVAGLQTSTNALYSNSSAALTNSVPMQQGEPAFFSLLAASGSAALLTAGL